MGEHDSPNVDYGRINNTLGKMAYHLMTHNSICVGVSGGSDSNVIVHMIATYFREFLPKIHFVFQNTGIEYRATLRHLDFLENHYDIKIDRIRGESVVSVCHREGFPILSKEFSRCVNGAERGVSSYVEKLTRTKDSGTRFYFTDRQKALATHLIENHIKVSDKCCDLSKKKPYHKYLKEMNADLTISGERRCEGGIRSMAHTDCFESGAVCDKYMPLFFWDDDTKTYYKEHEGIKYSDCYEVWGMKRTGCVGCPFNSRAGQDLRLIQKYEPQLYNVCIKVFGQSYRLMDKFGVHRHRIFDDQQLTVWGEEIPFNELPTREGKT